MDPLLIDMVELFRSKHRGGLTLPRLADSLGISRSRFGRGIEELRQLGYVFREMPQGEITLVSSPDRMIDTEIWSGLKTKTFARHLHCYRRIGSTNARAQELAEAGAPEGTVVVAEEQTKGRGRLGRGWHSASGLGIWSSIILRPMLSLRQASGISLLAALAFAESVEHELGLVVGLKWPNDGLIGGMKVFGVLTEVSAEVDRVYYAVCGTGINVAHRRGDFPPSLRDTAGSLAMAKGGPVDRLAFYRTFLHRFETAYRGFRRNGIAPFMPGYRERSILLGREVVVKQGDRTINGIASEVDDSGALVVRVGRRRVTIHAGEATLRM
ncbi:MAG: biotin--[acetyl-CoA-carboxylase] ligase [Candidatus Zixiibacteriota bacterium]